MSNRQPKELKDPKIRQHFDNSFAKIFGADVNSISKNQPVGVHCAPKNSSARMHREPQTSK